MGIGKDGKKRELHIDKALDVADLHGSAEPRQPLRVLKYRPGMASELLIWLLPEHPAQL